MPHPTSTSSDTIDQIRQAAQRLHEVRLAKAAAAALMNAEREAFEATHAAEIEAEDSAEQRVRAADGLLRQLVIAHYRATAKASPDGVGDKSPLPGIGVRVTNGYEYDMHQALDWAQAREMCITPAELDVRAFSALCKEDSLRPVFVKVVSNPVPTIAPDLSATLAAPTAAQEVV